MAEPSHTNFDTISTWRAVIDGPKSFSDYCFDFDNWQLCNENKSLKIYVPTTCSLKHLAAIGHLGMTKLSFFIFALSCTTFCETKIFTRFKAIKCYNYDPSGVTFNYCNVKPYSRKLAVLNVGFTLHRPINDKFYVKSRRKSTGLLFTP